MNEPKVAEAVEMLRAAEINCDNVSRLGPDFARFVKYQVQQAIQLLGHTPATGEITEENIAQR